MPPQWSWRARLRPCRTSPWLDMAGGLMVVVALAISLMAVPRMESAGPASPAAVPAPPSKTPAQLLPLWERYGLAFVRVPPGEFVLGNSRGDGDEDEVPAHTVFVDGFWIGVTEVTNGQYLPFVEAGGYAESYLWTNVGWTWREVNGVNSPVCWEAEAPEPASLPVQCLSWYEAVAYANWLARETGLPVRLPTEAEWEKAAHLSLETADDTVPGAGQANLYGAADGFAHASPAGTFPPGAHSGSVRDMLGNVWEWTSSRYADYPYDPNDGREELQGKFDRVVRGGGWLSRPEWSTVTARFKDDPDDTDGLQGMRLVVILP